MRRFILAIIVISILVLNGCGKEKAVDAFESYKDSWENKDYEKMYRMLSEESQEYISEEDFVNRYTNIYYGINAEDINIDIDEAKKDEETIKFSLNMDTLGGPISKDYEAKMIKEKDKWALEWDESLIFPEMEKDDEIRVNISKTKRGEIYDRFGNGLAVNGSRYSVGIHPSQYNEDNNETLSQLLDIDEEIIEEELEKNTNPEHFVPLVKLAMEQDDLINQLAEIEGVKYHEVEDRVYPGGEAAGALVGYIRPITAEQLEEDEDGVYSTTSLVGRFGLEEVYEETLRAIDGKEVYISKIEDGREVEQISLAKIDGEDGEDLHTSIDIELQRKIYEEMSDGTGASTAINPQTGEVLAMVSSPSFDSNLYTTYIPNSQKEKWDEMDVDVFENKFNKVYSPGSTFKILTAAIGLDNDILDPNEKKSIQGKGWQKDSSWGDYKVNRVSESISDVDLKDAFTYSDNIYFAMTALDIGENNFIEGSKKFGFGEDLPIDYPMENSQIMNDDKFENEILLADTGYGQGQVLMSPLHLSLVYSSVVNNGNIMQPFVENREKREVWKENVMSSEAQNIILDSLVNVIEDKNGTANEAKLDNIKLAGKTGTAELKSTQENRDKENGWFVAMNVGEPEIVISMMIESVEDRGGSKYILPKVRNVLEDYFRD